MATKARIHWRLTVKAATLPLIVLQAWLPAIATADWRDTYIDPQDGMLDASKYLSEHTLGFLPVPMIITEPAVGLGLGLAGVFFHESEAQQNQRVAGEGSLLPSNISMGGIMATENGSRGAAIGHLGFWKDDSIRYMGALAYSALNLDFYSLGGVELPRPIELSNDGPVLMNQIQFRLGDSNWFVGARQLYQHMTVSPENSADVVLLPPAVADFIDANLDRSVTNSGLGVVAQYDSRNSQFNPVTGFYYSARLMRFDDAIGSDVDYTNYRLSALNYWQFAEKFNLGWRVEFDGVSASDDTRLPPYVPPAIRMRGIPAARYQGNGVALTELQLDYQLSYRWKVGAFVGAGRAANSFGDLSDAPTVVSKGLGFRYLIARRYDFVMGLDVARGPEDTAVYIKAGSTW